MELEGVTRASDELPSHAGTRFSPAHRRRQTRPGRICALRTSSQNHAAPMSITYFPVELILHIAELLPTFPFPCESPLLNDTLLREYRSIRMFSQTFRHFRDILMPLVWRILEPGRIKGDESPDSLEQYLADHTEVAEIPRYLL
jgi:hypothetical protein